VPLIARELNLSVAEVHGVVTFYHYFLQERPGANVCTYAGGGLPGAWQRALRRTRRRVWALISMAHQDGAITLEPCTAWATAPWVPR